MNNTNNTINNLRISEIYAAQCWAYDKHMVTIGYDLYNLIITLYGLTGLLSRALLAQSILS